MIRVLRKKSLQKLLPYILAAAITAVLFLTVSLGGVVKIIGGPTAVGSEIKTGQYVATDASNVIVAFASLSESSDKGKTVLETYYLLPCGDQYIAVVDSKERNADVLKKAMDQSKAFYMDKTIDSLRSLGDISGTVASLEDGMESYIKDCIKNYSLPGSDSGNIGALILPYQINLNRVGFLPVIWVWILFGAGVVCLLLVILLLMPVFAGKYQKEVIAVPDAEAAFSEAKTIERIQVGEYIWYQQGAKTKVISTAEIVWGYALPEPLVVSKYRWPVALYNKDQESIQICFMDKKNCGLFLSEIAAQGGAFVSGYSAELAQKFKNDFEGFCKMAEENRNRA